MQKFKKLDLQGASRQSSISIVHEQFLFAYIVKHCKNNFKDFIEKFRRFLKLNNNRILLEANF